MKKLFRIKPASELLEASERSQLRRALGVKDLTAFGIAAIIGAGIFATIGEAAADGGPAVSLLFVFTAIACGFSALSYAQFASSIPIAGSAYTYAYATFGELFAWIIGWDLILEYAIGNIAVAISWSDYFTSLLAKVGIHFPEHLSIDYFTAWQGFKKVSENLPNISPLDKIGYQAWMQAPEVFGIKIIADIPAFLIVALITFLILIGIQESKKASNWMVLFKLAILGLFIAVGFFYVDTENWSPFAPEGFGGVMKGVAAVFFAYIGFDAISTTAEEAKNPQKDLPRAMILALIITTLIYVLISLIITGMVHYSELRVGDPLAYALDKVGLQWISGIIAFSALIAMTSVLLVFQLGQPRIWMSMSRDGLLPPVFSKIHPKFKTPYTATLIAGIIVAIPTLFTSLSEMTELTSIGTLFAFVLVNGGILLMDNSKQNQLQPKFKVPYYNSKYFLLPILILLFLGAYLLDAKAFKETFLPFSSEKLPMYFFLIVTSALTILSFVKNLSLFPVLGLITTLFLMAQLELSNWIRFLVWLAVGLAIYFSYGRNHSKLHRNQKAKS